MKRITFTPVDTLFFRDGRPYNQFEPQTDVAGLFPPFSPTLIGAFRAAVARGQGWKSNEKSWKEEIKAVLGNGNKLNGLQFRGPYLLQDKNGEETPLFPTPAILIGRRDNGGAWKDITRLKPGPTRNCDLGPETRLPVPEDPQKGLKSLSGYWLTCQDMQDVLEGKVPKAKNIICQKNIWCMEERTGNARDNATRVVKDDNALYSPKHVRLIKGISLALTLEGWEKNSDWQPQSPAPLGGESRMADIVITDGGVTLPGGTAITERDGKLRYTVIFISPADLGEDKLPAPGQEGFLGLPGEVISCCLGRPLRAGGWDSQKNRPLPLKPLLPPGSVLFMEADKGQQRKIEALHQSSIGERNEWGFGQILIGTWEEKS